MFWFLYISVVLGFSYLVSMPSKKYHMIIFCLFLVVLLTPAQIEAGSAGYAPALFSFIFNVLLEQDFSLRTLRPILLSLPICLLSLWLLSIVRKKFFLSRDYPD
jgi:hypothetical protein